MSEVIPDPGRQVKQELRGTRAKTPVSGVEEPVVQRRNQRHRLAGVVQLPRHFVGHSRTGAVASEQVGAMRRHGADLLNVARGDLGYGHGRLEATAHGLQSVDRLVVAKMMGECLEAPDFSADPVCKEERGAMSRGAQRGERRGWRRAAVGRALAVDG